ncbi:hypothetical protein LOD99_10842 [Oopsacas minuta]|uniref:PiggyBac transposable element-derived protein domain-containing protein n=1 Tax=Oopsacas minuta TaxID=111878 RepID=A0AAV7KGB6_9METZ|nr:hypothetical protein LOD99_10842 [Oopsacas minuta]
MVNLLLLLWLFTYPKHLPGQGGEKVGGRDVVLQLTEPYLDKGHVIYCDRFFSHLDIAAYLRSRKTGMIGTSNLKSLPADIAYLVHQMHPLTWVFKWFQQKADININVTVQIIMFKRMNLSS